MVEQLRTAKKTASAIAKAKTAMAAQAGLSKGFGGTGVQEREPGGEEDNCNLRDVPEWVTQQLPDLLRLLEACRLLSNVSDLGRGRGSCFPCCMIDCVLVLSVLWFYLKYEVTDLQAYVLLKTTHGCRPVFCLVHLCCLGTHQSDTRARTVTTVLLPAGAWTTSCILSIGFRNVDDQPHR